MNYVKQAYALSDSKKQAALQLYKEAVMELVQKDYCMRVEDAHTELSAIFGTKWLFTQRESGMFIFDAKKYAEANVAFNYANFTLGISGRFIELAKGLVVESERASNAQLKKMAKQMDSVLTATTEDKISITM